MRGVLEDLTGRRFGRLVVIEMAERPWPTAYSEWVCRCDCGNVIHTSRINLMPSPGQRPGKRSCGCLYEKHGHCGSLRKTPTYLTWKALKAREKHTGKLCRRWLKFENFLADMGERPRYKVLSRRDMDGPYDKHNCIWITRRQQWDRQRKVS